MAVWHTIIKDHCCIYFPFGKCDKLKDSRILVYQSACVLLLYDKDLGLFWSQLFGYYL